MKLIGNLTRLDNSGKVIIPKEVREELDLKDYEFFKVYTDVDCIILKRHNTGSNKKTYNMPEQITFE